MLKTKLNDEELHDLELMEEFTFVVNQEKDDDDSKDEEEQ